MIQKDEMSTSLSIGVDIVVKILDIIMHYKYISVLIPENAPISAMFAVVVLLPKAI